MKPKTLPIIDEKLSIDPKDPEILVILSTMCFRACPIAEVFRKGGYPIPTHAEEEQAHIIAWYLAMYQRHGKEWRVQANQELKAIIEASK